MRARALAHDEYAVLRLLDLRAGRGYEEGLRARADAGNAYAATRLAELLAERGDLDEAVQILLNLAYAGNTSAVTRLARLLEDRGDLDEALQIRLVWDYFVDDPDAFRFHLLSTAKLHELRARADDGDWYDGARLARLLADRGDLDALRARVASAGDWFAAVELARLLVSQARAEESKRLRRFGLNPDGSIAHA